jgi:hypothetical protein
MTALQSAEAGVEPVSANENCCVSSRPMPSDFAEVASRSSQQYLRVHYQAGSETIHRWLVQAGIPTVGGTSIQRAAVIPSDFAVVAPMMTLVELAGHYRRSDTVVRRWLKEAGVKSRAISTLRAMPDSFPRAAEFMGVAGLAQHYGAGHVTINRWLKEAGIAPIAYTPKHWRGKSAEYLAADVTVATHAARFLQRTRQVYAVDVLPLQKRQHLPNNGKGYWMVAGKGALDAASLVAFAETKGFDPDAWSKI